MNILNTVNVLYNTNVVTNYSPACYVCSNLCMANNDFRSRLDRKASVTTLEPVEFFRVTGLFFHPGVK